MQRFIETQRRVAVDQIRYQPNDECPRVVAFSSALQILLPNSISLVTLVTLVVLASGESEDYLQWVVIMALAVTGLSMIVHALRFQRFGSGRLIVANFNVPFLAVSALALQIGGPSLLASLIVVSTLLQLVLTLRLASLRRIFTPAVTGTVIMLVAVSAVPFIVSVTVVPPEETPLVLFLAPGLVALSIGVLVSLLGTPLIRMWVLPITIAAGLAVAIPLGLYDVAGVSAAPWLVFPDLDRVDLGFSFSAEFWALLPVFAIVNLTGFMKSVGDLSVIYGASYREPVALDFRVVQGGLNVTGASTFVCGLLGIPPVAAPWSATASYIGIIGVSAASVGVFLGLMTIAVALLSKLLAALIAVPGPVVSAVYVIIFGMLFIEGARMAFGNGFDRKQALAIGVPLVMGLSAGSFGTLIQGDASYVFGNPIVMGAATALGIAIFVELSNVRNRPIRVDLAPSALPAVDEYLSRFADRYKWAEDAKNRLRLVGEETLLILLDQEDHQTSGEGSNGNVRRLTATVHRDQGSAEVEFVVVSDDAGEGNLENRLAFLTDEFVLEDDEREISMRVLRHSASSVKHRKYHGIDVISCRVESGPDKSPVQAGI